MFTGIVRAVGRVVSVEASAAGRRVVIDPGGWDHRPAPGDSVACSGCCLTVVEPLETSGGRLVFDAVPETLAKTTLASWVAGDGVNLEAAARVGDRLDGHLVQGHVDTVGTVERVETGTDRRLRVRAPAEFGRYLVPKGSIAVDGVSLTLAAVGPAGGDEGAWFEVALIPETLVRTTLGALSEDGRVNLEFDVTTKAVAHLVEHYLKSGR